jgi:DNA-binding NtrC family response regulator
MVEQGRFREDLYYRLCGVVLELPPLRERLDDLPALVRHFIHAACRKYRMPEKPVSKEGLDALMAYGWPGNIRELSHTLERAVILADRDQLGAGDFELDRGRAPASRASLNLEENERRLVTTALEQTSGNVSRAADALGITRAALYRRIEKFGL